MSRNLEFVEFWKACQLEKPPFVHPEDAPVLKSRFGDLSKDLPNSFKEFVASVRFGQFADKNFHFALFPHPFAGDLSQADIVILQLNPGMNLANYHIEWNGPAFRSIMERNFRQDLQGSDFRFWPLDPDLCGTPGFRWWESKLREAVLDGPGGMAMLMQNRTYDRTTEDLGNIVALEHVNVTVPSQETAALFYVNGLGLTRDPYMMKGPANMWVNAGRQQFHLPTSKPQVLRGHIGVVVSDYNELPKRLARAGEALSGCA